MDQPRPVFLFTDFGYDGPYVGQMKAAVYAADPAVRVIDLMHDAPAMRPDLAAYLLAACSRPLPADAVVVAVVDPGVGGERQTLVVEAGGRTFVGPDNGLLSRLPGIGRVDRITWRPPALSASFHGRDLFAPVAAQLARGAAPDVAPFSPADMVGHDWPGQAERIVYVDGYGNLMTGMPAEKLHKNSTIQAAGRHVSHAETFCRVSPGELFWYPNSQGLVEIAANGASAAGILALALGDRILVD